jgi:tRNA-uridine 2-sulfurtransferase
MMSKLSKKVVVALSGGVDSAVAALLLKQEGWAVQGVHFLLPGPTEVQDERSKAVRVITAFLDIPLQIEDVRPFFENLVLRPFLEAYSNGLTPNPCVLCNEAMKFKFLSEIAERQGAPFVATGHYARVLMRDGAEGPLLLRGHDAHKDQSYFLHRLSPSLLRLTLFPLGEKRKTWVWKEARKRGLPGHSASESQEICFLAGGDYREFLESRKGRFHELKGCIIDTAGTVIGEHRGTYRYTVGQRKGLGIASSRPYYVKEIRPHANEIVVAREEDLYSRDVMVQQVRWISGDLKGEREATAQIRYRHRPAPGVLKILGPDRLGFRFYEPQWAVTPGQALVCYDGDRVLGGGWICRSDEKDF